MAFCLFFAVGCSARVLPEEYYTVVLNANGGQFDEGGTTQSFEVKSGDYLQAPRPTRADYDFIGWYTSSAATDKFDFSTTPITEGGTYYAGWSQSAFTVTFNLNYDNAPNGGVYKTEKVNKGATVSKPGDPSRDGYTFNKWTRDAAGDTSWSFDSDTVVDATTLYAQWTPVPAGEVLTGITVTTKPTKLAYIVGEEFDPTGMVVTAHYDGGADKIITDYQVSEPDMSTEGTKQITVTYKSFDDRFDITVSASPLASIKVTANPTKTTYVVGQSFDPTGMVVKAVFENGTEKEITDYKVEYDFKAPSAAATVKITYSGKETSVTVTVVARAVVSVALSGTPSKTYMVGDVFDTTGLVFTATYNDGTSESVSTGITFTSPALDGDGKFTTDGNAVITFMYGDITVTPTLTVNVAKAPTNDLTSFVIGGTLDKSAYKIGDTFSPAGLTFTATYELSGAVNVNASEVTFTAEGLNSALVFTTTGTIHIYAEFGGITADGTIDVTVEDKETPTDYITAFNVGGELELSEYTVGDTFYPDGLTFTATYKLTGATSVDPEYVTFHGDGLVDGKLTKPGTIQISASFEGMTAPEKIEVTVKPEEVPDELDSFAVSGTLKKTSYYVGEKFDPAGLTFTAHYTVSGDVTVEAKDVVFTADGLDEVYKFTKSGTVKITATYEDRSAPGTIDVTVTVAKDLEEGYYLLGDFNGWDGGTVEQLAIYRLIENKYDNGKTLSYATEVAVKLGLGDNLKIVKYEPTGVAYDKSGWKWGDSFVAPTQFNIHPAPALKLIVDTDNNDNIKVTFIDDPDNAAWYLEYLIKEGDDGTAYELTAKLKGYDGWYISMRSPANDGTTPKEETTESGDVYIKGNFTGEWKAAKEWSNKSDVITVDLSNNVYTFNKVYLKQYDSFKMYVRSSGAWLGVSSSTVFALGKTLPLSSVGSDPDVCVGKIADGFYDVIFDSAKLTLTVIEHVDPLPEYTVSFDKNIPYETATPNAQTVKEGGLVSKPSDLSVNGYTFLGWFREASCRTQWNFETDGVEGEMTLYAGWASKTVIIEYTDSETEIPSATWKAANSKNGAFPDFVIPEDVKGVKAHFTFVEWRLNGKKVTTLTHADIPSGSGDTITITLVAAYKGEEVSISYKKEDGSAYTAWASGYTPPSKHVYGTATKLPGEDDIVVTAGYTFLGWYREGDAQKTIVSVVAADVAEDVTYIIVLRNDIVTFTVTYYLNDGTASVHTTASVEQGGHAAEPNVPTREHYDFAGWYKTAECGADDAWNFAVDTVESDTKLYAKWTPKKYTVEFDGNVANGSVSNMPESIEVAYGSTFAMPEKVPTRNDHYVFDGWYKDEDCTTAWNFETDKIEGPTTIYAKWVIEKHDVTYYANKPTGVTAEVTNLPEMQKVEYGSTVAKPKNPSLVGYTFLGWYKEAACTTAWKFAGETTPDTVTGDVSLYAKWTKNSTDGWYMTGSFTNWEKIFENTATAAQYYFAPAGTGEETHDGNVKYTTKSYELKGFSLAAAMEFKIVEYSSKAENKVIWHDEIYQGSDTVQPITVTVVPNNPQKIIGVELDGNIVVKTYAVQSVTWTLTFVEKTKQGDSAPSKYEFIVCPDDYNELRAREGKAEGTPALYLAGNFTGGFALKPEWSANNVDAVVTSGKVYNFRNVPLKKYDTFKVVTVNGNNQTWMGGTFTALGTKFKVAQNTDDRNIYVNTITDGNYNIIVDMSGSDVYVTIYKAETLAISLNKTIYVGQTPGKNDVTVKVGTTTLTADKYTLEASAAVSGENKSSLTVTYNGNIQVFNYTAAEVAVSGIVSITLGKSEYAVGERFTLAGSTIVISKTFGDNETITDMNLFSAPDTLFKTKADSVTVTVKHIASGVTKDVTVTVAAAESTFDSNGGTPVEPVFIEQSGQVIEEPETSRAGYEFLGWFRDGAETRYNFSDGFGGSMTLTAKWKVNEYTITYDANGGNANPEDQTYTVENISELAEAPEYDHHNFLGWFTAAEDGTKVDEEYLKENPGSITLYAHWAWDIHTVSFELNGGAGITTETQTVEHGTAITMPEAPTKTGHKFLGWSNDNGLTLYQADQTYTLDEDTTFVAQWAAEQYDVTYVFVESNNYSASFVDESSIVKTYTYGVGLKLPTAADIDIDGAGYEFKGWAKDSNPNAESTLYTEIGATETGAKTFYAFVSDKASVTFTFDFNYDGANPRTIGVPVVIGRFVEEITDHANLTREGYTFLGWYGNKDGNGDKYDFGVAVVVPTTVYAKWEKKTYTVTFDANGGTDITDKVVTVDHGATVDRPTAEPRKTGYTFDGWFTAKEGGEEWNFTQNTITAPTTIYAHWTAIQITISFNTAGGTPETIPSITISYDEELSGLVTPEKEGYAFAGWWNGSTEWTDGKVINVTESFTLTAKWTEISYDIVYVVNVKVGAENVTATAIPNGTYVISDGTLAITATVSGISPAYFEFDGWVDKDGNKITSVNFGMIEDGVITVTATYKYKKYTVTFDPNGGKLATGTSATVEITYNEKITQPAKPSREGWTFVTWNYNGSEWKFATDTVKGDMTLVAQWSGDEGTFLYGSYNASDNWSRMYSAVDHNNSTEWAVAGVELRKGMQFVVVTFSKTSEKWYNAAKTITQYAYTEVVTIKSSGEDNANFVVTAVPDYLSGSKWTLYIKKDGTGISLEPTRYDELRDPTNTGKTVTTSTTVPSNVEVYLAGTFTDGFKYSSAWSSISTLLTVVQSGNTYTFRHVYLKRGDQFKVVLKGGVWYGKNVFITLDTPVQLTSGGYDDNVNLSAISDGFYDIVFDTSTKMLTVKTYKETEINVFNVSVTGKTEYKAGEPFDDSSIKVTITDSELKDHSTEYEIVGKTTLTVIDESTPSSTVTVTVRYTGELGGIKTKTFTINVKWISVTVKAEDDDGKVITINPLYDKAFSLPGAPTKTGYTFMGWRSGATTYEAGAQHPGVTDDTTITAVWDINKYTVSFESDGEPYDEDATVEHGGKVEKPASDPTKEGYTFKHWSRTKGGAAYSFDTKVTESFTLYAVFEINKYTVTFMADGEQYGETESIEHGATVSAPATSPSKIGYTFSHWSTAAGGEAYDFKTPVTGVLTLHAVFNAIEYDITYVYENCGIDGVTEKATFEPEHTKYTIESAFKLGEPTPPAGVTFVAWHIGTIDGETISEIVRGRIGALTLVAEYTQNMTVDFTFDYNYPDGAVGNTQTATKSDKVVVGLKAIRPTDPTLDSHKFLGWFTAKEGGEQYDFNAPVDSETTIYAHWEIKSFTITFDIAYTGFADPDTQTVAYGGKVTKPVVAERTGYTLLGWLVVGESRMWNFDTDTVTKSVSLMAQWSINKYTVTFDYNDGVSEVTTKTVTHGTKVAKPDPNPERNGYEFIEWQKDGVGYDFDALVTESFTLVAAWKQLSYTITFNPGTDGALPSGIGNTAKTDMYGKLSQEDLDKFTPIPNAGKRFIGWYTAAQENGDEVTADHVFFGDETIYARYVDTYVVTFDANGGSISSGSSTMYTDGDGYIKEALPVATLNGYDFGNWWDAQTGGTQITATYKFSKDSTVYAHWNGVTIVFDLNYTGATGAPATQEIAKNVAPTKPADPVRFGYVFNGWYTTSTGSTAFSFTAKNTAGTYTAYAKWTADYHMIINNTTQVKLTQNSSNTTEYYGLGQQLEANDSVVFQKGDTVYTLTMNDFASNINTVSGKKSVKAMAKGYYDFYLQNPTAAGAATIYAGYKPRNTTGSYDIYLRGTWGNGGETSNWSSRMVAENVNVNDALTLTFYVPNNTRFLIGVYYHGKGGEDSNRWQEITYVSGNVSNSILYDYGGSHWWTGTDKGNKMFTFTMTVGSSATTTKNSVKFTTAATRY